MKKLNKYDALLRNSIEGIKSIVKQAKKKIKKLKVEYENSTQLSQTRRAIYEAHFTLANIECLKFTANKVGRMLEKACIELEKEIGTYDSNNIDQDVNNTI